MITTNRRNEDREHTSRFRVPFIEQMEQSECGICCLAMILSYYKHNISLSKLREIGGGGRDGINLLTLRNIARSLGMESEGQKVSINGLKEISQPAILYWGNNHFVVLERVKKNKVCILDPSIGRRVIDKNELENAYSGMALILKPTKKLTKIKAKSVWTKLLKMMLKEKWLVSTILVWALWLQILALLTPMLTQYITDHVLTPENMEPMKIVAVGMLFLLTFQTIFTFLKSRYLVKLQNALDWQLMSVFFHHLLRLPYKFFQLRTSGDLILRANSNMIIREVLSSRMVNAILDGGFIIVFVIYMLQQSLIMTSWVLLIGFVQVIIVCLSNLLMKRYSQEELLRQTAASSYLTEAIHGISVVKSTGAEEVTYNDWSNLFKKQIVAARRRGMLSANTESITNILKFAAPLILLWVGSHQVVSNQMTLGAMFAFFTIANSFFGPLTSLVTTFNQIIIVGVYLNRVLDIIESPTEQGEKNTIQLKKLEGEIELRNVSFKYHLSGNKVVKNVSLKISKGEKVALVGVSGSGKSTLAHLLLGLYDPNEGEILYDGHDLSAINKSDLRKQLGVVTQDTFLFNRSVFDNIAMYNPNISYDQVVSASKIAGIHNTIMGIPMKYETIISEMGSNISGGQRQRIALARAICQNPSVLLLDEATSALDTLTEQKVDQCLSSLDCTRIVIAHRMSTIKNADTIIVIHDGQIVEQGTHEELMNLEMHYADLYKTKVIKEKEERKIMKVGI
ncbi:hypothetical protein CAI16_16985 [Virgibacillus dokdonensis]|uniref:Peptidase domain-containing ABC transporter n=1 Tax=Virgibacillus dokdonensis TaxID=302167 RepID=A0A3E0WLA0_9BACI|nr:peptidase domain-containing ABC transporter [Virgibacillus dokdonensis]RFA32756.1 hypothetical protein CAI16_16985 [Virgibacillus dokdonensis]